MKNGIKIVQRLSRPLLYSRTITHVRHYRGYGVHSPFIYSLVRNVFMKHQVVGDDNDLYDRLRTLRVSKKRSAQVQNLYTYCQYAGCRLDDFNGSFADDNLIVATQNISSDELMVLPEMIGKSRVTLCIMYPKTNARRNKACRQLIRCHRGMSVDNIGFVLLFYNDGRVKQHINL